jgi:hypothetical protein
MSYLKDPKIILIIVLCIIASIGYVYLNREITKVSKQYEQTISSLDSTHLVKQNQWKKDSLSLFDSLSVNLHKLDSMYSKEKESTTIKQIVYRTIYKDSTIEIITTDTQILKEKDQTIVTLTDSIANSKQTIVTLHDSITSLVDSIGKQKTEIVTKWKTDSIYIKPSNKFTLAGGVFAEATESLKLNYGINANAEYKVFGPVFIGAGISKDGVNDWISGYKLNVRIGAKLDF